ncbi:hypothetical protein Leryth_025846 [Lithospermum erythrorhizon]|nr:hypothetical protein Leryth_025846 [Lithospermum erythrorhizon]
MPHNVIQRLPWWISDVFGSNCVSVAYWEAVTNEPEKHVFHVVSDELNFGAMNMWVLLNRPGKGTIHVENVDEFKWFNSSYGPVLHQLESATMKEYYFKFAQATTAGSSVSTLEIQKPIIFYVESPQVLSTTNDDIVVQNHLTGLWVVDLHGKVNGAVETCEYPFSKLADVLAKTQKLKDKQNYEAYQYQGEVYLSTNKKEHRRQNNIDKKTHDAVLWKLRTLPPGLMTFYGLKHPLDKSWHVLGLGYNPSIDRPKIQKAAVIHYNGNMKP